MGGNRQEWVCASAGNHAHGVAFAAARLEVKGKIFMPHTTPIQKVSKVSHFGQDWIEVILTGDTFGQVHTASLSDAEIADAAFVHPFDDPAVIAGQGTIGAEILNQIDEAPDYIFIAIGGDGLVPVVGSYFKNSSPRS